MLTFFRRIRKSLLDGGSTSKYLIYAIGEIALVVIGILIALQVNNWNELRKERNMEKVYISRFIGDLQVSLTYLENNIELGQRQIERYSKIDSLLALKSFTSLDFGLALNFFYAASRGFENRFISDTYDDLNNSGNYSLIRNLKVRNSLNDYYQGKSIGNREYFSLSDIEPYRTLIRQLIPYKLQFKFRECHIADYKQQLCKWEWHEDLLESIFFEIYNHPKIRGYLNLMTQSRIQDFRRADSDSEHIQGLIIELQKQYEIESL